MEYNSQIYHRRSIRITNYDYAGMGAYFVTICTHNKESLFGDIIDMEMRLNDLGKVLEEEWTKTGEIRPYIRLDAFVVMPNHIHGILVIDYEGTSQRAPTIERFGQPTSDSIPTIVRLFKSATTKRINQIRNLPGMPVWQRNYYEHIIRNKTEWGQIRQYIESNPARWAEDRENPKIV